MTVHSPPALMPRLIDFPALAGPYYAPAIAPGLYHAALQFQAQHCSWPSKSSVQQATSPHDQAWWTLVVGENP